MDKYANKSSYLNMLPKEVRLNIADKLGIDRFMEFNEYLTDVIDTEYITILKKYNKFNDIIELIKRFPEFPRLYTWKDTYISMMINMDYFVDIDYIVDISFKSKQIIDILSLFFLFDVGIEYPAFYNDMVNICLSHGHGLSSMSILGQDLKYIRDTQCAYFKGLVSDRLSGTFPGNFHTVVRSDVLIYYLIGRKNSKMRWYSYGGVINNIHCICFSKLLQLKITDWIENIEDCNLAAVYLALKNNVTSIDYTGTNFKDDGMRLIRTELTRRGTFTILERL